MEDLTGNGENLSKLKSTYDMLERAFFLISDIKVKEKDVIQVSLTKEEAVEKASQFLELLSLKKNYEDLITGNTKEIERFSRWGDVDPADLRFLAEKGYFLFLYEIPAEYYSLIPETEKVLRVNGDKNLVRFILVSDNGNLPQNLPSQAVLVTLPSKSTRLLRVENEDYKSKIKAIERQIYSFSACKTGIEKNLKILEKEIEFENIYSGMDGEEGEGSLRLSWLTGFVPAKELKKVEVLAKQEKWGFLSDEPGEEDAVPTKLENNKVVSLIYPVSDFLGTVPGYREYDISSYFLVFFALFFAMIIGDGGYGLVFLIAAILMHVKSKKASDINILLYVLSIVTIIWGALTGTWFGSEAVLERIPFLQRFIVPAITNYPDVVGVDATWAQNMLMKFCFMLGAIQLGLARVMNIVRKAKERDLSLVAEAGWFIDVVMLYLMALYLVIGEAVPFNLIIGGIVTGFILVCVFSGQGPGISFIAGLKAGLAGFFTTFLDTISCFSNIMSYIRLFAVGMASLAIAQSFNGMAGGMLHGALIPVGILIIVLGHALNLVMGMLSVVVHGIRLNLLEFSGALGMEWSGYNYEPFRKMVNDKAAENS